MALGWVYRPAKPAVVVAALATVCVLLLAWAALAVSRGRSAPVPPINPEATPFWGPLQINAYMFCLSPYQDTSGQRWAHRLAVAAVALCVVFGPALGRLTCRRVGARARLAAGVLLAGACVALGVGLRGRPELFQSWPAGVAGLLLLALGKWLTGRGLANRLFLGLSVALLLGATVPGLLTRLDLSRLTLEGIGYIQLHFEGVLGAGDRLAAGQRLLEDVQPGYGVLLPCAAAAFQRLCRPLTMGDHVRILQAFHVLYLGLSLFLFYRHARGRWAFCLAGLFLVVPWYYSSHPSLYFPNQSAWRTIAFPLGLAALVVLRRHRLGAAAYLLGVVSGVAVLNNLETGVAASVGLATYLYFRAAGPWAPRLAVRRAGLAARFALGLVTTGLAFLAGCRVFLGYWPDLGRLPGVLENTLFWSTSNYGGIRLSLEPLPLLMFAHAAFVLIHAALASQAPAGHRQSFRAAVAAVLLVWFAYYANRPHPANLSSFGLLYGFLLIDLLRWLILHLSRPRRWNGAFAGAAAAAALVLLPGVYETNRDAYRRRDLTLMTFREPPAEQAVRLGGVYLPRSAVAAFLPKVAFVKARGAHHPVLYLTAYSYLIPSLSRVVPPLPCGDLCFGTTTRPRYQELLRRICRSPADEIYFDAEEAAGGRPPPNAPFLRQLRKDLAGAFEKDGVVAGWERWRRRSGEGAAGRGP